MKRHVKSAGSRMPLVSALAFCLLALASIALNSQAAIQYGDIQADQSFRQGVARFNDGYDSESITLFQKVLSTQPQNALAQIWLGRAFYYAGFESAAVQQWDSVQKSGRGSSSLAAFLETVQARRGLSQDVREDFDFFPVYELAAKDSKPNIFSRPAATIPLSDGSSILASFANNSLVVLNANGSTIKTFKGGLTHFAGPFDMVLVNHRRLYVTQSLGDQVYEVDLQGKVQKTWGGHGIGPGQFIGPQYITWDGGSFLFVSDFGNRRISKFDLDGNFIASFGQRSDSFAGLQRPTGIYFQNGTLFVADAARTGATLYWFDPDGNLLGSLPDDRFTDIERITPFEKGQLLISTRTMILDFDPSTQVIQQLYLEEKNPKVRFASTSLDKNGNLVASDFDSDKVQVFSRLAGIYSGLHVQIDRIVASQFPVVYAEVSVLDNLGNPVLGLEKGNFTLTEGLKPINDVSLTAAGYKENSFDGVILAQSDGVMASDFQREAVSNAVGGIFDSLGSQAQLAFASAGLQAAIEAPMGSRKIQLQASVQNMPRDQFWYLDLGLRIAVPQLIPAEGLRHIFFVGDGSLPEDAFSHFGMEESVAFLRNNRVHFDVIQTSDGDLDPGLQYLATQTGGLVYKLYDPKGLTGLGADLIDIKDGSYTLKYRSLFDSDFGRKYLPLEVGARLFQKSGRDESGYFAPLKY